MLCPPSLFFFSRVRRHTNPLRDWSSDVCSSDLRPAAHRWVQPGGAQRGGGHRPDRKRQHGVGQGADQLVPPADPVRSEERRVGEECPARSRPLSSNTYMPSSATTKPVLPLRCSR